MTTFDAGSTSPSPTSSERLRQAVSRIIREISLLYQVPNGVQGATDVQAWNVAFTSALLDECKDENLLLSAWAAFKGGYERAFWPAPGLVCKAIREQRADMRRYRAPPSGHERIAGPDYRRRDPFTPQQLGEWQRAMEAAETLPGGLRNKCLSMGRTVYEACNRQSVAERWRKEYSPVQAEKRDAVDDVPTTSTSAKRLQAVRESLQGFHLPDAGGFDDDGMRRPAP